ncbi:MAG: D-sedoheptulose 7-phosphate isomerase [Deltaproteobacteria bacterium]|nr:D-sedoheptulose 7-phosphate isomerase [Deltaproteobacteria bacterium]
MKQLIAAGLRDSNKAKEDFYQANKDEICRLAAAIIDVLRNGNKILIFGNGGSAADAQHMAAEFVNRFLIERPPLAALALTTDSSILTSIGNDFSFDDIFVKQIAALAKEGDLAMGISTSGNSANVIKAIERAAEMGLKTAALTGGSGGRLAAMAHFSLNVPTTFTPHIQETHLWVEHLLCQLVDEEMFGERS